MKCLNRSLLLLSFLPSLLAAPLDAATRCQITVGRQLAREAVLLSAPEISFAVGSRDFRAAPGLSNDGPTRPQSGQSLVIERRYDPGNTDWKDWWTEASAQIPRFEVSVTVPAAFLRTIKLTFEAEKGGFPEGVATLLCEGGFPLGYALVLDPNGSAVERLTVAVKKVTLQPTP
jgi:hypothetical protein